MSWGMVAGAAVGLVGNYMQNKGAKDAAGAAADANQLAIREQQRQFDLTREDMQPWMQAGQGALGQMQTLNSGDFSSFTQSPDYQFAFVQGLQALDRSAAAGGMLTSGGADADRIAFGQGLASQNYGNYYDRLAGLAGIGQTTAGQLGQFGANAGSKIGNLHQSTGLARASSYQQRANNNAQTVAGIGGLFNNWNQNRLAGGN